MLHRLSQNRRSLVPRQCACLRVGRADLTSNPDGKTVFPLAKPILAAKAAKPKGAAASRLSGKQVDWWQRGLDAAAESGLQEYRMCAAGGGSGSDAFDVVCGRAWSQALHGCSPPPKKKGKKVGLPLAVAPVAGDAIMLFNEKTASGSTGDLAETIRALHGACGINADAQAGK